MTRRILIELALFLTPFFIFYLFRAASRDISVKDKWPMGLLVAAGGVLAVGALVIAALREPSTQGLCYQARYLEDGVWVGGEMVPCDEVVTPKASGANDAAKDSHARSSTEIRPPHPGDGGEAVE